jgi:hypothetical protein
MPRSALSGRLRIGDEWNAISLIARTQSNPLKAVAELVENSLDARARSVEIVRARRGGRLSLTVSDDGQGIAPGSNGRPDFRRVATHICDSMKRRLNDRAGIHGEFGIGSTRNFLTGEKLDRYLAVELRDRIRQAGATVRIVDRVARKGFTVRPREFEGEPVAEIRRAAVPGFGEATIELYYRVPAEGESMSIYLCRDGTRILKDLRQLGDFERPPWTSNRLEGVVDSPSLTVAPATREGVVPDSASAALIEALKSVEPILIDFIRKREEAEAEKASESLLREIQRALVSALRENPEGDYQLFDVGTEPSAVTGAGAAGGPKGRDPVVVAGPLESAKIVPAQIELAPQELKTAAGRALDAGGVEVVVGLDYDWSVRGSAVRCEGSGRRVTLTGIEPGKAELDLRIRQGEREARALAKILVETRDPATGQGNGTAPGLPTYALVRAAGELWRSRYSGVGAIEINSAHRDYLAARPKLKSLRRYIGKLYAKEVILLNFPGLAPAGALDRMVELLTRMEERL